MTHASIKSPGPLRARLVQVDAADPDPARLADAAAALADGKLVAFPTETVYGLGANALNPAAIGRIYAAKGRPPTNPLIVHIADLDAITRVVADFPPIARQLADAFWPGPLTLILPRNEAIAPAVSAGLDTVAVRMPAHPVARALIRLAGVPVAAPSANRYTHVSPTRAAHVLEGLGDALDFVVDAGPTSVGLESTVLSLVDAPPTILRPGMITRAQLAEVVPDVAYAAQHTVDEAHQRPSPGMAKKHYAPRAHLQVFDGPLASLNLLDADEKVGLILLDSPEAGAPATIAGPVLILGTRPAQFAHGLYDALHKLDQLGCTRILVERPPAGEAWRAVHDRLARAAD